MNTEFIKRLINTLKLSKTYHQDSYFKSDHNNCKTPACIAGHAAFMVGVCDFWRDNVYPNDIEEAGCNAMGISSDVGDILFDCDGGQWINQPTDNYNITAQEAVTELQTLLELGETAYLEKANG